MSRNTKIVIALMVLCAIIVGIIGYWAEARRAKQTVATMATVVGAEKESRSGKRGKEHTIVILSYRAGTMTAQGRDRVNGVHLEDYPAGRLLRICYDPDNLKSLRIEDGACG